MDLNTQFVCVLYFIQINVLHIVHSHIDTSYTHKKKDLKYYGA